MIEKNSIPSCQICGKLLTPSISSYYLEEICNYCWNDVLGGLAKLKRDKWVKLLCSLKQNAQNNEDLIIENRNLNRKLEQTNIRQENLSKKKYQLEVENTTFRNFIIKYFVPILYHITPIENLPAIMKNGLLSRNSIELQGVDSISYSNQEIVENRSTISMDNGTANDYVPLFFAEKPPMLSAIEHSKHSIIVYICIKGEIIKEEGIRFSDGNIACRGRTNIYASLNSIVNLDWDNIKTFNKTNCGFDEAKRIKSAEVLVPSRIDPSWFEKFIVPNEDAKNVMINNYGISLPVEVNADNYFTRSN